MSTRTAGAAPLAGRRRGSMTRRRGAATHLLHQLGQRHQLAQVHPSKQCHLEVIPRLRRVADVLLRLGEDVEGAHQIFTREPLRQLGDTRPLGLSDVALVGARGIDRHDHQIAHEPRRALDRPGADRGQTPPRDRPAQRRADRPRRAPPRRDRTADRVRSTRAPTTRPRRRSSGRQTQSPDRRRSARRACCLPPTGQ